MPGQTSSRTTATLIFCAAFLPLIFLPIRFEAHETYRAGLLLILVLFAIPHFRHFSHANRLVALALAVWSISLIASTVSGLSLSRALFGDLIRGMGLITQLTLFGVILIGSQLNPATIWRWFWFAGVVVGGYAVLQSAGYIPNPLAERVYGLLGAPTYTGGWLALAVLWAAMGAWRQRHHVTRLQGIAVVGGIALMLYALFLTGSRGALLAVGAGSLIALLLWTAVYRKKALALLILFLILAAAGGLFVLNRMDWQNSPLASLPLISRLNPALPDTPRAAREKIWSGALNIARNWPAVVSTNGRADAAASLRPLIGYGLESFETVFRPYVDDELRLFEGGHPVDRAHNDWLDTLVTGGWFGLLSRAGLWIAAIYTGLARLKLAGKWLLALLAGGILTGMVVGWNTPLLPLTVTISTLAALALWLILQTFRDRSPAFDIRAWIAVAVLVAHIVDLQFFFTTIATAVPAYLALGMLLLPEQTPAKEAPKRDVGWLWIGFGGAWLLRSLTLIQAQPAAYLLLPLMIALVWLFIPLNQREFGKIVLLWLMGWLIGQALAPEQAVLADVGLLIILLILMGNVSTRPRLSRSLILRGGLLVGALGVWAAGSLAHIHLRQAYDSNSATASADHVRMAVSVQPWDDKLHMLAGTFMYEAALNRLDGPDVALLNEASGQVEQAMQLNVYDSTYPAQLTQIQQSLKP